MYATRSWVSSRSTPRGGGSPSLPEAGSTSDLGHRLGEQRPCVSLSHHSPGKGASVDLGGTRRNQRPGGSRAGGRRGKGAALPVRLGFSARPSPLSGRLERLPSAPLPAAEDSSLGWASPGDTGSGPPPWPGARGDGFPGPQTKEPALRRAQLPPIMAGRALPPPRSRLRLPLIGLVP